MPERKMRVNNKKLLYIYSKYKEQRLCLCKLEWFQITIDRKKPGVWINHARQTVLRHRRDQTAARRPPSL
jgi:hypothetical protein